MVEFCAGIKPAAIGFVVPSLGFRPTGCPRA